MNTDFHQHPWRNIQDETEKLCSAPTMLNAQEVKMLHWLGKQYFSGIGEIVDAGCFLGGSTTSIASGLALNQHVAMNAKQRIHSFDLFLCPHEREVYAANLIQMAVHKKKAGDSFLDLYHTNIAHTMEYVRIYPGDILTRLWDSSPIEILFIDISKTWDIDKHIIKQFFSSLIPGKSIVVQQDYFHPWCPWVHITMRHFKEYFEPPVDEYASRIYRLMKPIPLELLTVDLEHELNFETHVRYLDESIAEHIDYNAATLECTKAVYLFLKAGLDPAIASLNAVRHKYESVPFVKETFEQVDASLRSLRDLDGYGRYFDTLFKKQ